MSDEGQQVTVNIGPPLEPDFLRPTYANHVNINYTPHDFRFTFSILQIPLAPPPQTGELQLQPTGVATVVIPATLMHAVMALMNAQFGKYLEQFGPPGMDPRGPGA